MKRMLLTGLALALLNLTAYAQGPVLPPGAAKAAPNQTKAQAKKAREARLAQLNALRKGQAFTHGRETYHFLLDVRAARGGASALQAQGVAAADLLEAKGPFQIFQAPQGSGPLAAPLNGSPLAVVKGSKSASYPVVLNTRTGGLGVVNGQISTNLKRVADAAPLASAHRVKLVRTIRVAKLAILEVAPGQDPQAVLAALQADSRVAEAHLDILEQVMIPQ